MFCSIKILLLLHVHSHSVWYRARTSFPPLCSIVIRNQHNIVFLVVYNKPLFQKLQFSRIWGMDPSYDVIIQDVCTLLKSCHQFFYDVWDPYYGFLKRKPPYIELHAQPLWDPRILVIHMLLHKWPDAIIQWIQIAALRSQSSFSIQSSTDFSTHPMVEFAVWLLEPSCRNVYFLCRLLFWPPLR